MICAHSTTWSSLTGCLKCIMGVVVSLLASTRVFLCTGFSICVMRVLRQRQSSFTCSCKSLWASSPRRNAARRYRVGRTNTQLLMWCCCWLDAENDGTKLPLWLFVLVWFPSLMNWIKVYWLWVWLMMRPTVSLTPEKLTDEFIPQTQAAFIQTH